MGRKIFVNLAVADLDRSKAFFEALGFGFNPQCTDATAACMVISDDIYAMLLTREKFGSFAPRPIADSHAVTEVLTCISFDSKDDVDRIAALAVANGGRVVGEPKDHECMYYRSFEDPDGHVWEVMWMDPAVATGQPFETSIVGQ